MLCVHFKKVIVIIVLCISLIMSLPYYNRAVEAAKIKHGADGWEVSPPQAEGMNPYLLLKADRYISKTDAVSMIVVKHERIVFEKYYRGQVPGDLCFAYPTANSLLASLTGIAIGNGQIESVNQKVSDFFPEQAAQNADARVCQITVKNLLTMTSGFIEPPDDIFHKKNWIGNLLKLSIKSNPGLEFTYSPKTSYLLSGILTKAAGMNAVKLAKKHLFSPLKASPGIWHTGPEGMNTGGEYLYLRPADIAKFGCLYLNNGTWKDQTIIPDEWVKESLKVQVDLSSRKINSLGDSCKGFGYGFAIRSIGNRTVYTTEGDSSMQSLCLIPELDIVLVITSYHSIFKPVFKYSHLKTLLQNYIIPAAESSMTGH